MTGEFESIPQPEVTYLGEVQRLHLETGDVVVLSMDHKISTEQAGHLEQRMESLLPGHKCLVLGGGLKLTLLKPSTDEAVAVHVEGLRSEAEPAQAKLRELLGKDVPAQDRSSL